MPEETLDPQDWQAMRELGHRMLDDMLDHLQDIRQQPVWQHAPDQVKAHFRTAMPNDPQPVEDVYQEFLDFIRPYPIGNNHPRFWGWLFGTGTVMGAYADMLAAAMNTNSGDLDHHSAVHVENQVLNWCKQMLEYPDTSSGLLTSGCSVANLIGLAVARNAKAGYDLRAEGVSADSPKMIVYASQGIHSSIQKAVELLGLGSQALRHVPVNRDYQIEIAALEDMIAQDRQKGYLPFCVVGAAGTVNTGACDDLEALADLCQRQNLWLHVDGAFGAWAMLSERDRHRVKGLSRADSLAFDLHKWMYLPYEVGCILVRHPEEHRNTFSLTPVYLEQDVAGRGLTGGDLPWLTDYDFHLSRSFRALKAWMTIKEHGRHKFARLIQQNIDQARYLGTLIDEQPWLELVTPVVLNVVCFRYLAPDFNADQLDALNKEILVELQEQGIAVLSGTTISEKYVLRVGNTNHRTRRKDFDLLIAEVLRLGSELASRQ
jgi:aromatic-L-amino-acid/L-tryptophan decarboxylase